MSRFMRREITKIFFVPTIADTGEPSPTEVNAGTNLTPDLSEITGFTFSNSPIMTPDMDSAFVNQIPGEDSTDESGMVFYLDRTETDIYDALEKGTDGYVVIFDVGIAGATPAAADVADVWPVTISSRSKRYSTGNEAATFEVKFAMTDPPIYDTVLAT